MSDIIINSRGEYQDEFEAVAEDLYHVIFSELERQGVDSDLASKIAGKCEKMTLKALQLDEAIEFNKAIEKAIAAKGGN